MSEPVSPADDTLNDSPPFADVNLYESDAALREAVGREGGCDAEPQLRAFGARAGSAETLELGRQANVNPPRLVPDEKAGPGAARVEFDPAYHAVMSISMGAGLHCSTWDHLAANREAQPGAYVARGAAFYMAAQMEAGHCCPVTMTHAAVAALRHQPDLLADWLPKILSRSYDPDFEPATEKASVTIGMGMTERQGGTDVQANTTRAEPVEQGGPGREYRITGHKWFMSAPMCDAFLVLAQAPGGLSCFLMPRFLPDGGVNAIDFLRLKDKLGNRSNASSEVEFRGARGWLVGKEGRGVRTIIEMVTLTRLDCAVSSAALMRFALAAAIHHCRHRSVFQKKLADHPLMARVLADMALEVEAATMLVFRLLRAFDDAGDELETAWRRLMTPVAKYRVCKAAPTFAYEAMECLGGNGYVEDASPLARLFREAPVNAIWEGSGNVMCLDVLRVAQRDPGHLELLLEDWRDASRGEGRLLTRIERIEALLADGTSLESNARLLTGLFGEVASGVLMRAHAPEAVAGTYLESRLGERGGRLHGEAILPGEARAIFERALPEP